MSQHGVVNGGRKDVAKSEGEPYKRTWVCLFGVDSGLFSSFQSANTLMGFLKQETAHGLSRFRMSVSFRRTMGDRTYKHEGVGQG